MINASIPQPKARPDISICPVHASIPSLLDPANPLSLGLYPMLNFCVYFDVSKRHIKYTAMGTKAPSPLEKLARKQKLPSIVDLLNESLKTTGITTLARMLNYEYTNLSQVLKLKRRLPFEQSVALCRMHGFNSDKTLFILADQEHMELQRGEASAKPVKK